MKVNTHKSNANQKIRCALNSNEQGHLSKLEYQEKQKNLIMPLSESAAENPKMTNNSG